MKLYLQKLYEGSFLTSDEAQHLLHLLCSPSTNQFQTSAILSAFNMRPLHLKELTGFQNAMMEMCIPLDIHNLPVIDVCGTGGDGKDTFNISTLSAFVLAGANISVAKHGNYAVSSACGSSNVLEYLGLKFSNDSYLLNKQLSKANICILHAPLFHPAMKHVAEVRKAMQVKTFFNILGPLCNPTNPKFQCSGTYNEATATLYHHFLEKKCTSYTVVYDTMGFDEISLTGEVLLYNNGNKNTLSPSVFTTKTIMSDEIKGGKDIAESAKLFLKILDGKGTAAQNEVVFANSTIAINTYFKDKSIEECKAMAVESLMSKKAFGALKTLLAV